MSEVAGRHRAEHQSKESGISTCGGVEALGAWAGLHEHGGMAFPPKQSKQRAWQHVLHRTLSHWTLHFRGIFMRSL